MNENIIELLKNIEKLSTEELERLSTWIEFNLKKRESELI